MRRIVIAAAMSLFVVSLATVASADTLVMRDGSRIEGTVTGIAGRTITFRHADGTSRRYPTSRVGSLEFFSADGDKPRAAKARRLEAPVHPGPPGNGIGRFSITRNSERERHHT